MLINSHHRSFSWFGGLIIVLSLFDGGAIKNRFDRVDNIILGRVDNNRADHMIVDRVDYFIFDRRASTEQRDH